MKRLALSTGMIVALSLGLAASAPTAAETLVSQAEVSEEERATLESNPALAELALQSPELLREALDLIAHALANPSSGRGGLEALDDAELKLLGQNPALLQAWRSSPEASADLLVLIKKAAGGGGSQK